MLSVSREGGKGPSVSDLWTALTTHRCDGGMREPGPYLLEASRFGGASSLYPSRSAMLPVSRAPDASQAVLAAPLCALQAPQAVEASAPGVSGPRSFWGPCGGVLPRTPGVAGSPWFQGQPPRLCLVFVSPSLCVSISGS